MAPVKEGYWGPTTATIDWCEGNYEVTQYIAEFWNTVSNLAMILPPIYGAYVTWRDKLEFRYVLCYCSLLVVGLGSWSFHMTLKYEMQLVDELSMLLGTCILVYCLETVTKPKGIHNWLLALVLSLYMIIVTAVYLTVKIPVFHHVAYGILVFITVVMDIHLARTHNLSMKMVVSGFGLYIFGFLLWNIDKVYCKQLIKLRSDERFAIFSHPLTQFHAWWHILAGYATYMHIIYCCSARLTVLKRQYRIKWCMMGIDIELEKKHTVHHD